MNFICLVTTQMSESVLDRHRWKLRGQHTRPLSSRVNQPFFIREHRSRFEIPSAQPLWRRSAPLKVTKCGRHFLFCSGKQGLELSGCGSSGSQMPLTERIVSYRSCIALRHRGWFLLSLSRDGRRLRPKTLFFRRLDNVTGCVTL